MHCAEKKTDADGAETRGPVMAGSLGDYPAAGEDVGRGSPTMDQAAAARAGHSDDDHDSKRHNGDDAPSSVRLRLPPFYVLQGPAGFGASNRLS